jgi:hypothetical protein
VPPEKLSTEAVLIIFLRWPSAGQPLLNSCVSQYFARSRESVNAPPRFTCHIAAIWASVYSSAGKRLWWPAQLMRMSMLAGADGDSKIRDMSVDVSLCDERSHGYVVQVRPSASIVDFVSSAAFGVRTGIIIFAPAEALQ